MAQLREKGVVSRATRPSLVAVFAALTVVLNLSPLKFPAPYAPFLWYQVWEIPIAATFLLFGFPVGIFVALVNMLVLLAVFPGALPTGPLYNFAATLSMLLGMWLIIRLIVGSRHLPKKILALLLTAFGVTFRVAIMSVVNWAFLRFPPPFGYSLTDEALRLSLPLIALFNATLALYTIPIGYIVAEMIRNRAKIP